MKKTSLLLVPGLLLTSCGSINSYSSLIKKMKTYEGVTVINNSYYGGHYFEEGFFLNEGEISLYSKGIGSNSTSATFITLPNSTSAPNVYYCLYAFDMPSISSYTAASFYLSNSYTRNSSIYFDTYVTDYGTKQSDENLAQSSVNLLLSSFDSWLDNEFNLSLKRTEMFPNF